VAQDPFLEAGIDIPEELPYTQESHRDEASRTAAAAVAAGSGDEVDAAARGVAVTLKNKVGQ